MTLVDKNTLKTSHKVRVNPEHGRTVADAYDALQHNPKDPGVIEAYDAFKTETREQFDDLTKGGLKITRLNPGEDGYASAEAMHNDILENKHLSYFPSEEGFGKENNFDHPMLAGSGVLDNAGKDIPHNDLFRIVHDVNGHNLSDLADFSVEGEQSAFLTHKQQYSPIAQKALFTETAGQANWGAFNKKSGIDNLRKITDGRVNELDFAEQKAGILPDNIINGKWHE